MPNFLHDIIQRLSALPPEALPEALEAIGELEAKFLPTIALTPDAEKDLELARVEIEHGDLASDQETTEMITQLRSKLSA